MMARLFESIQAYIFAKADAETHRRREEEALSINRVGPSAENQRMVRETQLSWVDLGLIVVETWHEKARSRLEKLGIVKPKSQPKRPMIYVGDPDTNTKPIRKNFLTQRSTLPTQGEKSVTEHFN
jgi:hypothetical protein